MKKSYKNFAVIFLLGISSGIPLALILSTLKAFLLEKGFDLKTIGFFSLVAIPYSLKIFLAPVIDSQKIPLLTKILGQRKSWIILTQFFLVTFIALLGVGGIFSNLTFIAIFAILIACASASQDIVIDGYRIELIEKESQGIAASFYVYGYRIGLLIAGALALVIAEIFGWNAVYFFMSIFMLSCLILTIFVEETRKNFVVLDKNFVDWFKHFIITPLRDLTQHQLWFVMLMFIILFKLPDAFAGSLTLPFLLETGFSKIEIAKIVKTFGLFATLAGALCGGLIIKKFSITKALWIAAIMQAFSNLAFAYQAQIGYDTNVLYAVIFIENFSGGIGDSVFVAYLSGLCNVTFSATQYALLTSFASTARSFLTSSSGIFAQNIGWYNFFILSAFLGLPAMILLFWLTVKKIRKSSENKSSENHI
jgi:PAT family beta-lactamase induction signal transducer AmpG